MKTPLPVQVLRTVALATQQLTEEDRGETQADSDLLFRLVEQLGCVQIDTLNMVRRSHYLVPWSRLGSYEPKLLDDLLFGSERRLFEGWQHAASIIPLGEYRHQMPLQRKMREQPSKWYQHWQERLPEKDYVPKVLERIRQEGPLRVKNFSADGQQRGTWWDWRPAKVALEFLFSFGDLMISNRVNFQREYELTKRYLPRWVEKKEPSSIERDRYWVERGAKALGICLPRHAGDYTWMKVTRSRPIVEELVKEGILLEVAGKTVDGKMEEFILHKDTLPLLEQAADGTLKAERTTFLSPFDNLFWATRRDEMFWGFRKALECYLPAHKRIYGYFCLPILHKDRLVGRFDPKLERKNKKLIVRALYLEPGEKPTEELVAGVASAFRDFLAFHQATSLDIERSDPVVFGKKLTRAL